MSRILNYQLVSEKMLKNNISLVSTLEFERLFYVSKIAAQKFLAKYASRGVFIKVKNGLYGFNLNPPAEMIIANRLYAPSYLSFEYALNFYGLIPESVYVITSATTKPTRAFNVGGKAFAYHRLKPEVFQGYLPRQINNQTVFMAEPAKALADYLYFADLKKKTMPDRLNFKRVSKTELFGWLKKFNRPSLINLAKSFYA